MAENDAQVKNAINAIKAQLTAASTPADFARLGSEAAGLVSTTNNPDLIKEITGLQSNIATKEEISQTSLASNIDVQHAAVEAAQQTPEEIIEQQKLEKFNSEHERITAQHETFLKTADNHLDKLKKENEKKEELLKELRAGKDIDPKRLESFKKTPEQIEAEKQELEGLRKHQAEANKHHAEALIREEEAQKARAKTAKELEERRNAIKDLPPAEQEKEILKLKPLENRLAQQDSSLADLKLKVQKTGEMKTTANTKIEEIEKKYKKGIELDEEIKKEVEKDKEKNPQKYNKAVDFADLYNNQTKTTNEIDPLKKPVASQEETPANQKNTPSTKPTATKEHHTIGDRIVELKEQLASRPALKGEVDKIAGELKTGLQNPKNTIVNSKENEIDQQKVKTAQQNKKLKNEGHTR